MSQWAPVIGAGITAIMALLIFAFTQRQAALERKRKACAEALTDALAWLELPYRIRRRTNDDHETLAALVDKIHSLQERLIFHDNWLRVELPAVWPKYKELVSAVKVAARPSMQEAWIVAPRDTAASMNLGPIELPPVEQPVAEFVGQVRKSLSWWPFHR